MVLLFVCLYWPLAAHAGVLGRPYANVGNRPFATTCKGPQSGYVVTLDTGGARTGAESRLAQADAEISARLQGLRPLVDFLRRRGGLREKPAFTETIWVASSEGKLVTAGTSPTVAQAQNELTFTFTGWSAGDQAFLQDWLAVAYPAAKALYGTPAFNLTVEVVCDPAITGFLGGVYVAGAHQMRLSPLTGNQQHDEFVATTLMLHAFRDSLMLYYDAWEKGMARAAAEIITMNLDPNFDLADDPFYLMSFYDLLNQDALGNPAFAALSEYQAMFPWRVGMSAAVWLKVWAEHPDFFQSFNAAYYPAASGDSALAGNVPALRAIAAGAAPLVEGKDFQEWFEQQWAMDTSVRLGRKLFAYQSPLQETLLLALDYYDTLPGGEEAGRGGTANLEYFDYTHTYSLFAQEGYQIAIPGSGADVGQGFLAPTFFNIGGPQRVAVEVDLDSFFRTYYFAYAVREPGGVRAPIYGYLEGDNSGSLTVEGLPGQTPQGLATNGAFSVSGTYPIAQPSAVTLTYTNSAGQQVKAQRNVTWGYYVAAVPAAGTRVGFQHLFLRGSNGVNLVSIPFYPAQAEPSAVFGLPPDRLLLAEYVQGAEGGGRYRLYPQVAELEPGRGYFLKLDADVTLSTLGVAVSRAQAFVIELPPGWNLIGDPFEQEVLVSDLRFAREGEGPISLAEAVDKGWVGPSVYQYTQAAGYSTVDRLQPWRGYWILVTVEGGVRMLVSAP